MKHTLLLALIFSVNLMVGGCAHSTPSPTMHTAVPMAVIAGGPVAGGADTIPGGLWITNREQLDDLTKRMFESSRIRSQGAGLPDIDFSTEGVLVVWMGRKTSGGYALELMAQQAEIENRTARVPVRWIEPRPGAVVTQMMTNPYLMIRLARGGYDTITIFDPDSAIQMVVPATAN